MKKYIYRSFFVLAGILLFGSCEKFLDRAPLDQISQATFWRTPGQLDAYIVGKYNWLPGQFSDWNMGYFISEISSDNMIKEKGYQTWMNGENNTLPTSGGGWDWGPIREINMFFDNYHLCESPFETYAHTYGEACFLKAMRYHNLVVRFGDVPWYSGVIADDDEALLTKARDPRALVVDSIMSLIDQSITHLKFQAQVGNNRLNKETALIYKSRVALYEATWSKYHANTPFASGVDAEKYFNKVVESYQQFKQLAGGFEGKLYSTGNPEKDYYNLFNRFDYADVKEVTLSKSYSRALGVPNNVNMQSWFYGYGGCSYTLDLVRSYLTKDGHSVDIKDPANINSKGASYLTDLANTLDPRFRQSVFVPKDLLNSVTAPYVDSLFAVPQIHLPDHTRNTASGFSPKKGHNPDGPMNNQTDPLVDGIGFRIPELMLNYVEAYVELNKVFPDLSDNIDLLRKRVGMPTLTAVKPTVGSWWPDYGYPIDDNLAIVRQERRVELVGEGYRNEDWKRWRAHNLFDGKRPRGFVFDQTDYDKIGVKPTVELDANGYIDPLFVSLKGGGYTFNWKRDYLSPIPTNELLNNKNLKQNPGWED